MRGYKSSDRKPLFPVRKMRASKISDSDGNRVNVGDLDSNGLNVNNYSPDNSDSNLRVVVLRQFSLDLKYSPLKKESICFLNY